ncbi:MAG: FkbM family methyltransferase [Verrucomicrobiota bacterium]|nr:FkbM family methyltransferase [Verrucomicrobiota bacterium]
MNLITTETARRLFKKYPFIKSKSAFKNFLKPFFPDKLSPLEIHPGLNLHLDYFRHNERVFWSYEEIEAPLQFYIDHYLPLNANFIDCGAHTGLIGFLASRRKNAHVVLIEARQEVCDILQQSLDGNPALAKHCQLIRKPCALNTDDRFSGSDCITLKAVIESFQGRIDFLKVDVDGPDFEVLSSAGDKLTPDQVTAIFIEIPPSNEESIQFLRNKGYKAFVSRRMVMKEIKSLYRPLIERDCFARLIIPHPHKTRSENILFLADGHPLEKFLSEWCDDFRDVSWQ